jgi:putative FmdB family regulatory protein
MPVYEYVCQECGNKFDALRTMQEADAPIPCDSCQSEQTHRALSVCFCQGSSEGEAVSGSCGCGGCSGGNCGSCSH